VSWVLFIVIFGLPLITWHADNRATEEA
jgi:hypothetical protein